MLPVLVAIATVVSLPAEQPRGQRLTGGTGLLYIGTYAGDIQVYDEATETLAASIKLQTGIPRRAMLSRDGAKFYVLDATLEKFEVVDVATRTTDFTFTLSEGNKKTRVRSFKVDDQHRYAVVLGRTATRQIDRWDIGPATLYLYDLQARKVARTIDWPKGEEREFLDARFSPDGRFLYLFDEETTILETTNFTVVDTWRLSRPIEPGLGEFSMGPVDEVNDEPGFFTGLFRMRDPVAQRSIMGIGRVNLMARTVDFKPIGPAERVGFSLAPGRKVAYGLYQDIGRYEFWKFDVEAGRVLSRTEFAGRPRMGLRVSSNGRVLYVYVAGATIDLYDASTYRYLRTITMNADQTTDLYVVPRPAAASTARQ
ncbi:MAG: hypothetical protein AB1635_03610 [Acidobacteriota bacterium]